MMSSLFAFNIHHACPGPATGSNDITSCLLSACTHRKYCYLGMYIHMHANTGYNKNHSGQLGHTKKP